MSEIWVICFGSTTHTSPIHSQANQRLSHDGVRHAHAVVRATAAQQFAALYVTDAPCATYMAQPFAEQHHLLPVTHGALKEDTIRNGRYGQQKIHEILREIAAWHDTGNIAIYASPAACQALLCTIFGLSVEHAVAIQQDPGAINRIIVAGNRIIVTSVNDLCHLYA